MSRWSLSDLTIAVALILVASLFLAWVTPHGMGTTPDSLDYLEAALRWQNEGQLVARNEVPYVQWPPLYPLALSVFPNLAIGARVIAIVTYAALGALTYTLARQLLRHASALAVALIALLSMPILEIHLYAWSEQLFLVITLAWLHIAWQPRGRYALPAMTALACLALFTRYIGILFIPLGALLLLVAYRHCLWRAVVNVTAYALSPAMLFMLWSLRNLAVGGRNGPPSEPLYSLGSAAIDIAFGLAFWLPYLATLFAVIALIVVLQRRKRAPTRRVHRSLFGAAPHQQYPDGSISSP